MEFLELEKWPTFSHWRFIAMMPARLSESNLHSKQVSSIHYIQQHAAFRYQSFCASGSFDFRDCTRFFSCGPNAEEHGPWLWQMKNIFPGNMKGNTFLQIAETSSSRCAICKPWRHAPTLLWHAWRYKSASKQGNCVDQDLSERARESDMSNIQNQRYTHLTKTKVTKISYDNIHMSSRERERQRGGRAHGCVYVFGHFCKQKCLLNSSQNVCLAA